MWNNAKDKYSSITVDRVRELFDYDDNEGYLRWKVARQKINKGDIAGYISSSDGYWYVCIDYVEMLAHRAIWLWKTGQWPKCQIDHKDRNRSNNKWNNLREATNSENMRNVGRTAQSNNRSTNYRGIDIKRGKYRVRIHVDGKEVVVGRFLSLQEAKAARLAAEEKYWARNAS